jgi:hypothetical protein
MPEKVEVISKEEFAHRQAVELAEQIAAQVGHPMDRASRPGGYTISSSGIPIDFWGKPIPEEEWTPEDKKRLKGIDLLAVPIVHPGGAEVVTTIATELKRAAPGARKPL